MAERKTRREYFAVGAVITERRYNPDGTKAERFYATTKKNGGEPSGRELDDAFQVAQMLSAYDGMQDRLNDMGARLADAVQAMQAAKHCYIETHHLTASILIALDSAIEHTTIPRSKQQAVVQPEAAKTGLYRVHWKSGEASLACVHCDEDGTRWLAPTNWLRPGPLLDHADDIALLERLEA